MSYFKGNENKNNIGYNFSIKKNTDKWLFNMINQMRKYFKLVWFSLIKILISNKKKWFTLIFKKKYHLKKKWNLNSFLNDEYMKIY